MHNLVKTPQPRVEAAGHGRGHSIPAIVAAAADLALVIDTEGLVRDLSVYDSDVLGQARRWLGRRWADTVTSDSQPKIEAMLAEALEKGVSCRCQVTHPAADGPDLPVEYNVVHLGADDELVAIGRDLRALGHLQGKLVEVQQMLERDYLRMRHFETRYRLLCDLSAEAVVLVDAHTMKVVEANPAAARLWGMRGEAMPGKAFPFGLDSPGDQIATEHLAAVRAVGSADPVSVTLAADGRRAILSASLVRHDTSTDLLVRLVREGAAGGSRPSAAARAASLIEASPDAHVVTDLEGHVLAANRAFLDLVQVGAHEQARGQSIGQWIGRPGADLPLLLAVLREHGVVRLFATAVRGNCGSTAEVELSAATSPSLEEPCVGITLRNVSRRPAGGPVGARHLTRAVEELTGLVGRVSLRDLVRDTIDLVERHFIEAALELTNDNRTSAAEVLGVSRQSLYVKLRRYGLRGAQPPAEDA
jgi:transcriptional regulator PpsR